MATTDTATRPDLDSGDSVYDGFISYSHAADGLLAPRLQTGLQRFTKPWWKRRALHMFRDEASLSANPDLWASITEALDQSDWFILLLSEDAAASRWVDAEVAYWREHKDPSRIIPVVTDGGFGWHRGDIAEESTAAPPSLRGAFTDEPRWVDLRWARQDTHLDLSNSRFRQAVADIASAIRGIPKDELESEEVRQHRRTIRTVWTAGITLAVLLVVAVTAAVFAYGQSQDAQDQARLARSRELAANAVNTLDRDPELSLLLALMSADQAEPSFESVSALHEAIQNHRGVRTVFWPDDWVADPAVMGVLSPDGRYLAISGAKHQLAMWEVESRAADPIWKFEVPLSDYAVMAPYFASDSSHVIATVGWFSIAEPADQWPEPPPEVGIYVLDVETGETVHHWRGPRCPAFGLFQSGPSPIDLSRPVGVGAPSAEDCSLSQSAHLFLMDMNTGEFTQVYNEPVFSWNWGVPASMSANGRYLAFTDATLEESVVVDTETGEKVLGVPGGNFAILNTEGTRLLAVQLWSMSLWDVQSRELIWEYGFVSPGNGLRFSDDERFVIAGAHDGVVRVWDAANGKLLRELRGNRSVSWIVSTNSDSTLVASASGDGAIRVWDLSGDAEGEIAGFDLPGESIYQSGKILGGRGAILTWSDHRSAVRSAGTATVFEVPSGATSRVFGETYGGQMVRLSRDGTLLAGQPFLEPGVVGPVHIRDVGSGEVLTELQDLCSYYLETKEGGPDCAADGDSRADSLYWADFSPDGSKVAIGGGDHGIVGVWNIASGERLAWLDLPGLAGNDGAVVAFSPDSDLLAAGTTEVVAYDTQTWSAVGRVPTTWGWRDLMFTSDGRHLMGVDVVAGEVVTVDTTTWQVIGRVFARHEGAIQDVDLSSDESLLASGGSDGHVLVWDREEGALLQSIPIGSPVTLVEFVDDQHLLVIPQDGPARVLTISIPELIDIARSNVTRGFAEDECQTYRIDPCPTLDSFR